MHRQGFAKTGRERAVECCQVPVIGSQRAISRQACEHLAFGRSGLILLESLVSRVCRRRHIMAPQAGLFFKRAALSNILELAPGVCHFNSRWPSSYQKSMRALDLHPPIQLDEILRPALGRGRALRAILPRSAQSLSPDFAIDGGKCVCREGARVEACRIRGTSDPIFSHRHQKPCLLSTSELTDPIPPFSQVRFIPTDPCDSARWSNGPPGVSRHYCNEPNELLHSMITATSQVRGYQIWLGRPGLEAQREALGAQGNLPYRIGGAPLPIRSR